MKTLNKIPIEILGTTWNILVLDDLDEYMSKTDSAAYTNKYAREIIMVDLNEETSPDYTDEERERIRKQTLRHEIIHAFMFECGLGRCAYSYSGPWSYNEEMIDWFAHNWVKIQKIYETLEIAE